MMTEINSSGSREDCPGPDELFQLLEHPSERTSAAADIERIRSHLKTCPACRDVLRSMDGGRLTADDVNLLHKEVCGTGRLRRIDPPPRYDRYFHREPSAAPSAGRFSRRLWGTGFRPWIYAAAAVAVLFLLVPAWNFFSADGVKPPVFRGTDETGEMDISPQGLIDKLPEMIEWSPEEDATIYKCEIFNSMMEPVCPDIETSATYTSLDEDIRRALLESGGGIIRVTSYARSPLTPQHQVGMRTVWIEIKTPTGR